jgi:hypothetical protein
MWRGMDMLSRRIGFERSPDGAGNLSMNGQAQVAGGMSVQRTEPMPIRCAVSDTLSGAGFKRDDHAIALRRRSGDRFIHEIRTSHF